jgi:hypothetical protein
MVLTDAELAEIKQLRERMHAIFVASMRRGDAEARRSTGTRTAPAENGDRRKPVLVF